MTDTTTAARYELHNAVYGMTAGYPNTAHETLIGSYDDIDAAYDARSDLTDRYGFLVVIDTHRGRRPRPMSDTRAAGIGTVEPPFGIGDLDEEELSQELWAARKVRETRSGGTVVAIVLSRGLTWVLYSDGTTSFCDGYSSMPSAIDAYAELVAETFGRASEVIG